MDYMEIALEEAKKAFDLGEVPVGCVIVKDGAVIGRGHNLKETLNDPSAHAEMMAIRDASKTTGNWRLNGCVIYITLEPCPMCASLITQARISQAVVAYPEYRSGAFGSKIDLTEDIYSHLSVSVTWDLRQAAAALMEEFFRQARLKNDQGGQT